MTAPSPARLEVPNGRYKCPPPGPTAAREIDADSDLGMARNASTEVREEISVVNPAPAGGSSQCRLSPRAHVLQPHHTTSFGDQSAERTCHRARHRQTRAPWMDQVASAHA